MAPTMKISAAAVCSIHVPSGNGSGIDVCGMAATTHAATEVRTTGTHHVRCAGGGSSRWRGAGSEFLARSSGVGQDMRREEEVMAMLHC